MLLVLTRIHVYVMCVTFLALLLTFYNCFDSYLLLFLHTQVHSADANTTQRVHSAEFVAVLAALKIRLHALCVNVACR